MKEFEWQKLKEVVLYILNETQGLDYYHIFKVLYFAERDHLAKYGTRIVADEFYALPYGPVPTHFYDAIKDKRQLKCKLSDVMTLAGEDASTVLLPKRAYNPDYLSVSDIECLHKSIEENVHLTFAQLKNKSHDSAWEATGHCQPISSVDMARAGGASEDMIAYIKEQIQIDCLLS